jgi:hypothetical protein
VRILAIDTATENCSAALFIDGVLTSREELLQRGAAERILPMVNELLTASAIALTDARAARAGHRGRRSMRAGMRRCAHARGVLGLLRPR